MEPKAARKPGTSLRASNDVIGKKVVNLTGEDIGDIKEVVIDCETGHVSYAILSFGGFLGVGDKLFAVPWVSLGFDASKDAFTMKANKELLKKAPGFNKNEWPDLSDPTRLSEIYNYYDSKPYWR